MERREFEAVLETFSEAMAEQYIEPTMRLLDVILLHLAGRSAIQPGLLASQLHGQLREMTERQRDTVGARLVERAERLCELLVAGEVSEAVLRKLPHTELRMVWDADHPKSD